MRTSQPLDPPPAAPSRALNITLWIVQVLVFLAFLTSGLMKLTLSIPELAMQAPWADEVPVGLVRFIGVAEVAGAIGVLLPAVTRIRPFLTPLAAAGLVTIMLLAMGFHLSRGDGPTPLMINATLGALALFVAWGRGRKAPIAPR